MQFEGNRRSSQVLNLTPLIDIVFLLLVFFMLTAHFVQDEGIAIALPEASTAAAMEEDKPLELILSASGLVTIDGVEIAAEQLSAHLTAQLANKDEKRIVIRGDAGVTLGYSVKVIDAARKAGASGVDIMTTQPAGR